MRPPSPRAQGRRFFASALLVAVAFLAFAGQASAAPCWQRLMLDWYDGSIDKTYPVACYQQAISNMGEDLKNYSSARDDIRRALQATIAAKAHTTDPAPTTTEQAPAAAPATTTTASTPPKKTPTTTAATTTKVPIKHDKPPAASTIAAGDTDGGDSVPVPLIILGGLALLLVSVGVIGIVRRRMQDPGE